MSAGTALDLLAAAPAPDPARARPAVARVLQGAGADLILFAFAPGQSLPDHRAAHPILVQCLRGALDFTWGGRTVRLEAGTAVHLPAGITHRVDRPAEGAPAAAPDEGPGGAAGGDPDAAAVLLLSMLTGAPDPKDPPAPPPAG